MTTKSLTEDDVTLLCLALRIAEKQFRADAVTVGAMHVGKLVTQFERQAERATALAVALEAAESVRVIASIPHGAAGADGPWDDEVGA